MAFAAFILNAMALAALIAAFVWQVRNLRSLPEPPYVQDVRAQALHPVSIVLLLEDADLAAEPSVASILKQDYPELELVVVDDRPGTAISENQRRLAPDPRMKILRGGRPARGWVRRSHAFFLGYRTTRHDWVLFVDDSVVLKEGALRRAMGASWLHQADLLTIVPRLTATGPWERLFMPFIAQLALLVFPPGAFTGKAKTAAPSFAPFLLFRRSTYEAIGGHASVRCELYEDMALTASIQHRGYRASFARGNELAVVQTLATFPRMWQALTTSFNGAFSGSFVRSLVGASLVLGVFALPWLLFASALLLSWPIGTSPWTGVLITGIAHVAMSLTYRTLLKDNLGLDRSLALLQPVAGLTAAAILVASHLGSPGGRVRKRKAEAAPQSRTA